MIAGTSKLVFISLIDCGRALITLLSNEMAINHRGYNGLDSNTTGCDSTGWLPGFESTPQ